MNPSVSPAAQTVLDAHICQESGATSPAVRSRDRRCAAATTTAPASAPPPLRLFRDTSNILRHDAFCAPASSSSSEDATSSGAKRGAQTTTAPSPFRRVNKQTEAPIYTESEEPVTVEAIEGFSSDPKSHAAKETPSKYSHHCRGGDDTCELHRSSRARQSFEVTEAASSSLLKIASPSNISTFHRTSKDASATLSSSSPVPATTHTASADAAGCHVKDLDAVQSMRRASPQPMTVYSATAIPSSSSSLRKPASSQASHDAVTVVGCFGRAPLPPRSIAASRSSSSAIAAASRVLFPYDADEENSHGDRIPPDVHVNVGGRSSGSAAWGRSLSGASFTTAIPDVAKKESYLWKLLTGVSSTDVAGTTAHENESEDVKDAALSTMWLRVPSPTFNKADSISAIAATEEVGHDAAETPPQGAEDKGHGKITRSAVSHVPRTPSPPHCATRSKSALSDMQCADDHEAVNGTERNAPMCLKEPTMARKREDSAEHTPPLPTPQPQQGQHPPQKHSSTSLSSSCGALRFSFPAMTLNFSTTDPSSGRHRASGQGTSPSMPPNLFSDDHGGATQLPEPDLLTITTAIAERNGDTSSSASPAEGLDMSSFRTPLSPCPSSIAPPFSVFPCAATSCGTTPVLIPAKMMKQRQRERAWSQKRSASPASQVPTYSGGASMSSSGSTHFHNNNTVYNSGNRAGHLTTPQHGLRESFGSLAMASITTGSLPSVAASAQESGTRGVATACDRFHSRSILRRETFVEYKDDSDDRSSSYLSVCIADSQQRASEDTIEEEDDARISRHLRRRGTSVFQQNIDPQPVDEADLCFSTELPSGTQIPVATSVAASEQHTTSTSLAVSHPACRAAAVPLRIRRPSSGTSTPPLKSPRAVPLICEASLPLVSPLNILRSSMSESPSSEASGRAAAAQPSCCASPWSPLSTKPTQETKGSTSAGSALAPLQLFVTRSKGTESTWNSCAGGHTANHGTRCCFPQLMLSSANVSTSCFSLTSPVCDADVSTLTAEQQAHQQAQSTENSTYIPCMSSAGSSHRGGGGGGDPLSTSVASVFTGVYRNRDDSFFYAGQCSCSNESAQLGDASSDRVVPAPHAPALLAAAATSTTALASGASISRPSSQHAQPRLKLCGFLGDEPLGLSSHKKPRFIPTPPPPPDSVLAGATPPAAELLPAETSQHGSPCMSPSAMHQNSRLLSDSYAVSAGLVSSTDRRAVAHNVCRHSPLHFPVSTRQSAVQKSTTSAVSTVMGLTAQMSRCALTPCRKVRSSLSPSPFPQMFFHSLPTVPVMMGSATTANTSSTSPFLSPSCNPSSSPAHVRRVVADTDVVNSAFYSEESELCGLESVSAAQSAGQHLAVPETRASANEACRDVGDADREPEVMARAFRWPLDRADGTNSRVHPHKQVGISPDNTYASVEGKDEECMSAVRDDQAVRDTHESAIPVTQQNERSVTDSGSAASIVKRNGGDGSEHHLTTRGGVSNSSMQFTFPLELVQPPPVTRPRSPSPLTVTSASPFSSFGSPAGRSSRHGSPLFCVNQAGLTGPSSTHLLENEASPYDEWNDEELPAPLNTTATLSTDACETKEPRLPASAFHYAFSSLRGSRSRQEDSVTLTPDLLIYGGKRPIKGRKEKVLEAGSDVGENTNLIRGKAAITDGEHSTDFSRHFKTTLQSRAPSDRQTEPVTFTCFGVFDGHCGDAVSSLASQYFPDHFEFAVKEYWAQWAKEKDQISAATAVLKQRQGALKEAADSPPSSPSSSADVEGEETTSPATTPMHPRVMTTATDESTAAPAVFQRVISAALVQSLVHLDLTLYDALHCKRRGRSATQCRDAGSTASVVAFFKVPHGRPLHEEPPRTSSSSSAATAALNAVQSEDRRDESTEENEIENGEENAGAAAVDTYRLCIANLGDSRAIIGNKHTRQLLLATTDHRISACPSEEARIAAAGGVVELGRVDGSLDVTRGLGDYRYKVDPTQWWAAAAASERPSSAMYSTDLDQTSTPSTRTTVPASRSSTRMNTPFITVAASSKSPSTTAMPVNMSQTENVSAVRALRWHSGSTTPVHDSLDNDNVPGERTTTATEGLLAEEKSNREVRNELNAVASASAALLGSAAWERHIARENRDENLMQGHTLNQWQQSILNSTTTPSTAADAASLTNFTGPFHRECGTEAEFLANRTAAATSAISFPSSSPISSSAPASPLPNAALTGNAVSNIADVYEWEVHRDDVLVIASDGVWDSMTSEEVLDFVCRELQEIEGKEETTIDLPTPATTTATTNAVLRDTTTLTQEMNTTHNLVPPPSTLPLPSSPTRASKDTPARSAMVDAALPVSGTPTITPLENHLQHTPSRLLATVCHAGALRTPCGDGGGCHCSWMDETPGGVEHSRGSRSSAVQAVARRLTEYVVNTLSGSDNTTAIVVVFQ